MTPANGYGNVRFVGFRVGYRQKRERGQGKGREGKGAELMCRK